jgi:hypothetical protein
VDVAKLIASVSKTYTILASLPRDFKEWIPRKVRNHFLMKTMSLLHYDGIHPIRQFAIDFVDTSSHGHSDVMNLQAIDMCGCCRRTMGQLLKLRAEELHCCLKFLVPGKKDAQDRVGTWGRSRPFDAREPEAEITHLVSRNTVWCALLGRRDESTAWGEFRCFSCNNLPSYKDGPFHCDRQDWFKYYQSTLVFPIRYVETASAEKYETVGFLAFDSPKKGAFWGLPDIFEFRLPEDHSKWAEYHDRLSQSAVFHVGAILADTISMGLRPYYASRATTEDVSSIPDVEEGGIQS